MTWPLATGLGHLGRTSATDADGQLSIWNVAWVARTLVVDPLRVFDANIFHPHKTTLAYSEANLLPGAIGVPVVLASRNPWLTLNVVMLVAFASAFVCAYLLLLYLTGDRGAAAAGAVFYTFCPYVMSHLSHIQLLLTGGIPLSLLDAASAGGRTVRSHGRGDVRWARTGGAGAVVRLLRDLRRPDGRIRHARAGGIAPPVEVHRLLDVASRPAPACRSR